MKQGKKGVPPETPGAPKEPRRPDLSASDVDALLDAYGFGDTTDDEPELLDLMNLPRPTRDDRDPGGVILRQMLNARCDPPPGVAPGMWENDAHEHYKREHPEFDTEYKAELTRRFGEEKAP